MGKGLSHRHMHSVFTRPQLCSYAGSASGPDYLPGGEATACGRAWPLPQHSAILSDLSAQLDECPVRICRYGCPPATRVGILSSWLKTPFPTSPWRFVPQQNAAPYQFKAQVLAVPADTLVILSLVSTCKGTLVHVHAMSPAVQRYSSPPGVVSPS